MNSKQIFALILASALLILTACGEDDTPSDKRRSSYLDQTLKAAPSEAINCGEVQVLLPSSSKGETLDRYILRLHGENANGDLAKLSIAQLQLQYRSCIRANLLERFEK